MHRHRRSCSTRDIDPGNNVAVAEPANLLRSHSRALNTCNPSLRLRRGICMWLVGAAAVHITAPRHHEAGLCTIVQCDNNNHRFVRSSLC
jgi:hypothetical protein